jgi:molybdopterin synthase sulfur carrier subunit
MIRVMLPAHLRNLAGATDEVLLEIGSPITARRILETLEDNYPVLRGTIRDQRSGQRRPLVRFFAVGEDISHESPDAPAPDAVATGAEPFVIIGAMAGG